MLLYNRDYKREKQRTCSDHRIKEICDGIWSEIMGTHSSSLMNRKYIYIMSCEIIEQLLGKRENKNTSLPHEMQCQT